MKQALLIVTSLTLARVPFVLLFMVLALLHAFSGRTGLAWIALTSLVLASLTDLFDGMLARRWRVTTPFGAMADPLTDKVFYLVVFPTLLFLLAQRGEAELTHAVVMLVFTVFYLLRDQWVTFLRAVGASFRMDLRANWMGKLRTAISFPIGCAVYVYTAFEPAWLGQRQILAVEIFGILLNAASIHVYTRQYLPALKQSLKPGSGGAP